MYMPYMEHLGMGLGVLISAGTNQPVASREKYPPLRMVNAGHFLSGIFHQILRIKEALFDSTDLRICVRTWDMI